MERIYGEHILLLLILQGFFIESFLYYHPTVPTTISISKQIINCFSRSSKSSILFWLELMGNQSLIMFKTDVEHPLNITILMGFLWTAVGEYLSVKCREMWKMFFSGQGCQDAFL